MNFTIHLGETPTLAYLIVEWTERGEHGPLPRVEAYVWTHARDAVDVKRWRIDPPSPAGYGASLDVFLFARAERWVERQVATHGIGPWREQKQVLSKRLGIERAVQEFTRLALDVPELVEAVREATESGEVREALEEALGRAGSVGVGGATE